VFYLKQQQPSGAKLIELPDWKLFFLRREGVERLLFEAHQRDLLEYHVAGSVTRFLLPTLLPRKATPSHCRGWAMRNSPYAVTDL
jgi:hypothetical protein